MELENKISLALACQMLRLTREQTLRRVHRGEIRGEKIYDRWLIDGADLARFIRDRDRETAAS